MPKVRIKYGHKVFINGSLHRAGGVAQIRGTPSIDNPHFNPRAMEFVSDETPLALRGEAKRGLRAIPAAQAVEQERIVEAQRRMGPESEVDEETASAIMGALGRLDHEEDEHWTTEGKPRLKILTEYAGLRVTAEMLASVAPDVMRRQG